jgi:hypothetical protein
MSLYSALRGFLDVAFDDKRVAVVILMTWMWLVILALYFLGLMQSDFMSFGPSHHTKFMTLPIDTWEKWIVLALACFANTCVSIFLNDAIGPWLTNTITDHKAKYLPYSKFTCYVIYQMYIVYWGVMGVFGLGLTLAQIDFLLIRLVADFFVSTFTVYKFMGNKTVDILKYNQWNESNLRDLDDIEKQSKSVSLAKNDSLAC